VNGCGDVVGRKKTSWGGGEGIFGVGHHGRLDSVWSYGGEGEKSGEGGEIGKKGILAYSLEKESGGENQRPPLKLE